MDPFCVNENKIERKRISSAAGRVRPMEMWSELTTLAKRTH